MAQFAFGTGYLVGISNAAGVQTPRQFGALQDVSIDISASAKELMGQYQFPLALARGAAKITGKAKAAQIYAGLFGDLFFNQAVTTGRTVLINDEQGTVASNAYTALNTTGFVDLGANSPTGLALTKVASAPAAGQYSVTSGGVYSFAAGDSFNTKVVTISYTYTSATGSTITVQNQLLGVAPSFQLHWMQAFQGQKFYCKLFRCMSNKLSFSGKTEDFDIPDFDFGGFADPTGNVFTFSSEEV